MAKPMNYAGWRIYDPEARKYLKARPSGEGRAITLGWIGGRTAYAEADRFSGPQAEALATVLKALATALKAQGLRVKL